MADFKDILGVIGAGKPGGNMSEQMELAPKIKDKVMKHIDQAKELIEKEGLEPLKVLMDLLEPKAPKEEGKGRKQMLIMTMKKRRGEE